MQDDWTEPAAEETFFSPQDREVSRELQAEIPAHRSQVVRLNVQKYCLIQKAHN